MTVGKPEREGSPEEPWLLVRERTLSTGGGAWAESQYWRECAYLECLGVACSPNTAWLCQHGGTWEDITSQNQVMNYELRLFVSLFCS